MDTKAPQDKPFEEGDSPGRNDMSASMLINRKTNQKTKALNCGRSYTENQV